MPAAFRDALQPLAIDATPSSTALKPLRPITYDDIAPWLTSTLPARKRFAARFHTRLADSAFRADAEKVKLLVTPMTGGEVARHIAELYATPAELVTRAKAVTGE